MSGSRIEQANEYLNSEGFRKFNSVEIQQVESSYQTQLIEGTHGIKNSLGFYPSHLRPVHLKGVKDGSRALIAEVGGTNGYAAVVEYYAGVLEIKDQISWPLKRIQYPNTDEFFQELTHPLKNLTDIGSPDALALIYSFPGETLQTPKGVDVNSPESLPKGFVIPGISHRPVGQTFLDYLSRSHTISPDIPLVVMNDTVAVLCSVNNACIGGVIGTGFNFAVNTPQGIINTESGGFDGMPMLSFDKKVDAKDKPSTQFAEKRIAGKYLGLGLNVAIEGLIQEGLIQSLEDFSYSAETVSELLNPHAILHDRFDPQTRIILQKVARGLIDRSIQLSTILAKTAVLTFKEEFKKKRIQIPIEGSVFWKTPGYKDQFTRDLHAGIKRPVTPVNATGRLGAAGAAFSLLS